MTGDKSLFSCIKPDEEPPQHPPSPPSPAGGHEGALSSVLPSLQERLKKLEEFAAAATSAVEAARAEAKVAQDRSIELEKQLMAINDSLRALMDKPVYLRPDQAEQDTLKKEVAACAARMVSIENDLNLLESDGIKSISLSLRLLDGRLINVEAGLNDELNGRLSASLCASEASSKAALALETANSGARRLERLEEMLDRLPYIDKRFAALETKLERVYELDALAQALKMSVEGTEGKLALVMKEAAAISGEQNRLESDFDSLSAQVRQMADHFNRFRTELSFLIPKKQGGLGGD